MINSPTQKLQSAIKRKLAKFSKLGTKDNDKSYEVLDIVSEIDSLKGSYLFNTTCWFCFLIRCDPIVAMLPHYIQEKLVTEATNHKLRNRLLHPKFPEFVAFLEKNLRVKNDRSLYLITSVDPNTGEQQKVYPSNLKAAGVHLKGKYRILELYRKTAFLLVKDVLFIRTL